MRSCDDVEHILMGFAIFPGEALLRVDLTDLYSLHADLFVGFCLPSIAQLQLYFPRRRPHAFLNALHTFVL